MSWLTGIAKMTGAAVGLTTYEVEQPPLDCAQPWHSANDVRTCGAMADRQHDQMAALRDEKDWGLIETWKDPEQRDMHLFTRKTIGNFHFLKASFSIKGCSVEKFVALLGSPELEAHQKFSADIVLRKKLDEPTMMTELMHVQYWCPPPVAARDFCLLVGRRENTDGSYELWGCSVESDKCPEQGGMTVVRGGNMFGWTAMPVGDDLLVTYCSAIDPRGWTPGFLLEWLKTSAAKEFVAIRTVLEGGNVKVEKTDVGEVASKEQIAAELEAQKAASAKK